MKHLFLFILTALFFTTTQAQEYKTYKKINDSTFVETRNLEEEEATEFNQDAVLTAFFRQMDRWANIKNRHFNNELAAQRVFSALNRDQRALIADTTYVQYNDFRNKLYSYDSLHRDETNQIVYDSRVTVGDTTYNAQLFRNAGGVQVLRIEEPAGNYAARFVESDKVIRVGGNTPLPQLTDFVDLNFIRETNAFQVYFARVGTTRVILRIRKQ